MLDKNTEWAFPRGCAILLGWACISVCLSCSSCRTSSSSGHTPTDADASGWSDADSDADADIPSPTDADDVDAVDGDDQECRARPGECCEDEECSNGLFCDGVEFCDEGRCRPREAVDCDDEIACTVDSCDEELEDCVNVARDLDEDGFGDLECGGDDCDDVDASVFPGQTEDCSNEVDDDCDGQTDCADEACGDQPECA